MSPWLLWSLSAAVLVVAVLLRLYAGDDPCNEIVQEQDPDAWEDGSAEVAAAA